ncbi:MAG: hypothetical protein QM755_20495 [Luteolibacter sp.]
MPEDMGQKSEIQEVTPIFYLFTAGVIAIGLWTWWAVEHYTNWRIGAAERLEPIPYLAPLIGSFAALIFCLGWWRRDVGINKHGIAIDAVISTLGRTGSGMQDVTLAYEIDGAPFVSKKSLSQAVIGGKVTGDTLGIIVDTRNPKRFMVSLKPRQK